MPNSKLPQTNTETAIEAKLGHISALESHRNARSVPERDCLDLISPRAEQTAAVF